VSADVAAGATWATTDVTVVTGARTGAGADDTAASAWVTSDVTVAAGMRTDRSPGGLSGAVPTGIGRVDARCAVVPVPVPVAVALAGAELATAEVARSSVLRGVADSGGATATWSTR
jgi:hypothetical protein